MSGIELAGSAVGIVSLSIQVAQGLLKYYESWKDFDCDVENLCASINNLSQILDDLFKAIRPPANFDKNTADTVEKNIKSVERSVEKLNEELQKVQAEQPLKLDYKSKMRRHLRRALYPFKEETLKKIQLVVGNARSNLDLALRALQMYVYP